MEYSFNRPLEKIGNFGHAKSAFYILGVYYRRHWVINFQYVIVLIFLAINFSLNIAPKLQNSVTQMQDAITVVLITSIFYCTIASVLGIIARVIFMMKDNVMYKRLGLIGINSRELTVAFIAWSLITTIVSSAITFIIAIIVFSIIVDTTATKVSSGDVGHIFFSANFFTDLNYMLIFFSLIVSICLFMNAIIFNSTFINIAYPILIVLGTLGLSLLSILPTLLDKNTNLIPDWPYINYNHRSNAEISQWPAYAQALFFIFLNIIGFSCSLGIIKLAHKKFNWGK